MRKATYRDLALLRATIRPADDASCEVRTIQAESPDYETARAEIERQTPGGWKRSHIIIDSS